MGNFILEWILSAKDETSGPISRVKQNLKDAENRTKQYDTAMKRADATLGSMTDKLKMLGLIGIGTMAAMFARSPYVAAGFELIKNAFFELFLALTGTEVLDALQRTSEAIRGIASFLNENPAIGGFIRQLVALAAVLGIVIVAKAALSAALIPLFSLFASGITILEGFLLYLGAPVWLAALGVILVVLGIFRNLDAILADVLGVVTNLGLAFANVLKGEYVAAFWNLVDAVKSLLRVIGDIGVGIGKVLLDLPLVGNLFRWILGIVRDVASTIGRISLGGIGGSITSGLRSLLPFAEGGIVTGPTPALIGESGPEAVIPLGKLGGGGMGSTSITVDYSNATINISDEIGLRKFSDAQAAAIDRAIQQRSKWRGL